MRLCPVKQVGNALDQTGQSISYLYSEWPTNKYIGTAAPATLNLTENTHFQYVQLTVLDRVMG